MPQPYGKYLNLPQHRIVIGLPQYGKSTFVWRLSCSASRVVLFEPTEDFESIVSNAQIVSPRQLQDRRILRGEEPNRSIRVIVRAMHDSEIDISDELVYVYDRVQEARDCVFIVDEVWLCKHGKALQTLAAMHMNGHKYGVVTILVSQRAVGIPLNCRATASHVHSFKQSYKDDLDALSEQYGEEFAQKVKSLPRYKHVTWIRDRDQ